MTSGEDAQGMRAVRFDRPLVELPGWADPRLARQLAEAGRAAREQGLAEGYAAGWAQGRRAAAERERADAAARAEELEAERRQLAARARSLLAALAQTASTLTEQAAPAWEELVDALVDGALGIAAAGLGRELASVDDEAREAMRTALRLLPSADPVAVHVHPDDAPMLRAGGQQLPAGLSIVADPAVAPGTVVARTALQTLPVDLRASLRAVEEVLRA